MSSRVRLLAVGGIVGPVAFVAAWVIGGSTMGSSAIDDAISDLAAVDASTRVLMTLGFVVFGLGLVAFGMALRETMPGLAWIAAVVTGASTIGVAATPIGGWSGNGVHAACAGLGYASIAALPLLAAGPIARSGHKVFARVSVLVGCLSAACLLASTLGPAHGLWQRVGLSVGDAWIVIVAIRLATASQGSAGRRPA